MKKNLFTLLMVAGAVTFAHAQRPTQGGAAPTDSTRRAPGAMRAAAAKPKPYNQVITDKAQTRVGLVITHKIDDKFFFEVADSVLNKDILVVSRISKSSATLRDNQVYAGDQIGSSVIRFERGPNNKLFIRKISFRTYSPDSTSSMYKNVQNSTVQNIAASFNVAAYAKDNKGVVVDATDFINSDNDVFYFSSPAAKTRFRLGAQLADRSFINSIKTFPTNTEINVTKTYSMSAAPTTGGAGGGGMMGGGGAAGSITIELNTSLVALPKIPMKARYFDPRVGYFAVGYTDFDANPQGVKDLELVKRWRLEPKPQDMAKYKRGELVEPAKPIIFYIDPATPKKWVPYLIAGVNDWQKAFEKAGFKNAVIGKMAPTKAQDSTWSLDDARNSAIVYKPSEIPNASGPSISDPRTGEIMESHINWYHNVMSLVRDWYFIQTAAVDKRARTVNFSDELMGDLIRFVSSHEVGHTLGLRHNHGSSSTVPVENLRNKKWVEENGHTPSIMDYARFNYVAQPEDNISKVGLYPRIGDYDKWAIEWGYKYFPDSKNVASDMKILDKMTVEAAKNRRLWFGTETNPDDPHSQSEDLSDNAMKASDYGIKNMKVILANLKTWTKQPGENYDELGNMYRQLNTQLGRYIGHVSKNIGGIYENPKTVDQAGLIYERTPAATQKEAANWLNAQVFTTPKWLLDQSILDNINESPLVVVSKLQNAALTRVVSTRVLGNLIAAEAADGATAYKISDLFKDLNASIFTELKGSAPIDVYRRNLQKAYVDRLITIINPPAAPTGLSAVFGGRGGAPTGLSASQTDAVSVVKGQLRELDKAIKANSQADTLSKYHLEDLSDRIEQALDNKK
ncbi:MAG: DUF5117 domain-containing protein [Pedobacter sp.]|nr:MAG: DUF5117 domain-containing protein [Pedobacter sp.]